MCKTFKVGQRVKLKKISEELLKYEDDPGIVPEMIEYFGKCVTIKNEAPLYRGNIEYYILEDNAMWRYDARWFENPSNKLDIE